MTAPGRRVRAWVALAAFSAALVVPFVNARHVFRLDDAACATQSSSDPAAAGLGQGGADDRSDHCAFCHWLRAVGGSQIATGAPVRAASNPIPSAPLPDVLAPRSSVRRAGPARAPPLSL